MNLGESERQAHWSQSARYLTAGIAGVFALLCAWVYTAEDAFISFRYANEIGDGIGPI